MSFVGPRPPLPEEVECYTEYQKQRLKVLPGLTCMWQIMPERNDIAFHDWVEMDLDYAAQRRKIGQSLSLDVPICFRRQGPLRFEGLF